MEGAAIATAAAYLALFLGMMLNAQRVYHVPYQWRRVLTLAGVAGGLTVLRSALHVPLAGAIVLPLAYPLALLPLRLYQPDQLRRLRGAVAAVGARRTPPAAEERSGERT